MKKTSSFLQVLSLALLMSINISAQDVAMVDAAKVTSSENYSNRASYEAKTLANQSAIAQIRAHIAQNISYPDQAIAYGTEGIVVVEVKIDKQGMVKETSLVKRLAAPFDLAVMNALKNLDRIELSNEKYSDLSTVHIPVRFTNSL